MVAELHDQTSAGEGDPSLVSGDEVVENLHTVEVRGLTESGGDQCVVSRGFRVSGWVVVCDDDG